MNSLLHCLYTHAHTGFAYLANRPAGCAAEASRGPAPAPPNASPTPSVRKGEERLCGGVGAAPSWLPGPLALRARAPAAAPALPRFGGKGGEEEGAVSEREARTSASHTVPHMFFFTQDRVSFFYTSRLERRGKQTGVGNGGGGGREGRRKEAKSFIFYHKNHQIIEETRDRRSTTARHEGAWVCVCVRVCVRVCHQRAAPPGPSFFRGGGRPRRKQGRGRGRGCNGRRCRPRRGAGPGGRRRGTPGGVAVSISVSILLIE